MKSNGVHSMIAVPFWKRPTGFLVVRNPKRYINRTSLLKMMAFVAVSSTNEKRLMYTAKLKQTPEIIQKDNDVIINLFDGLQIITETVFTLIQGFSFAIYSVNVVILSTRI